MQSKKFKMQTFVALLAIFGLICGLGASLYMKRASKMDSSRFHGTWLDETRAVSAFELIGTSGPFNNESLKHHWTMMFFGFTTCSSICPTTMSELAHMTRILEKKGVQPLPQIVLISLDPEHDSLGKVHDYVTAFHPDFQGARGNEASLKKIATEMGVAYMKVALSDKDQKNYNIEHTGTVMLINPEGKLTAFFTMPHHATLLAKDYQLALATHSP